MPHSSNMPLRGVLRAGLAACALIASAFAGAWVHASIQPPGPLMDAKQERALAEQITRDGAYVRENLDRLARKVGSLQAQVMAMESLGRRIADEAGVDYASAEVQAGLEDTRIPLMHELAPAGDSLWSAEGLGRRVDLLSRELERRHDWLATLEFMLSEQAGLEASLPTLHPVEAPYESSSFGWRRHPVTGRHSMHEGLDFPAPRGTPIHAASGGVVVQARYVTGYGKLVEIDHGNGLTSRYAHASSILVKLGDVVAKGDMIARVGSTGRSTGPHLHFEVRMAGHPLDPRLFLGEQDNPETLLAKAAEAIDADETGVR